MCRSDLSGPIRLSLSQILKRQRGGKYTYRKVISQERSELSCLVSVLFIIVLARCVAILVRHNSIIVEYTGTLY